MQFMQSYAVTHSTFRLKVPQWEMNGLTHLLWFVPLEWLLGGLANTRLYLISNRGNKARTFTLKLAT